MFFCHIGTIELAFWIVCLCRADLEKRRAEKELLEAARQRENLERLTKDMEKSKGGTVVLSTGLKDKGTSKTGGIAETSRAMDEDEEEEEDEEGVDEIVFSDDEEDYDEGENEEEYRFDLWGMIFLEIYFLK